MKEYILDRTLTKAPCIYKRVGNTLYPIVYLRRAKNAMNEDFEEVVNLIANKRNGTKI